MQFQTYNKRPIRFTGTDTYDGWQLKQYSISAHNEYAPQKLFQAAKKYITGVLPQPPCNDQHYGVGFMIIHEGLDGNYALVSWWVGENMLCHHVLAASTDDPLHFKSFGHTNIVACVWEMEILYFEKKLWSEAVLMAPEKPDFDKYLMGGFSGNI